MIVIIIKSIFLIVNLEGRSVSFAAAKVHFYKFNIEKFAKIPLMINAEYQHRKQPCVCKHHFSKRKTKSQNYSKLEHYRSASRNLFHCAS